MQRYLVLLCAVVFLSLSACKSSKKTTKTPARPYPTAPVTGMSKYEQLVGAKLTNETLVKFIETWYGTPYRYAGKTRSGVDCSGFTSILLKEVYNKNMQGSSASLYSQSIKIDRSKVQEGDLVFFRTDGSKGINHVGVYLANGYFVHASTSRGVIINNMSENYYDKSYCCAGRWWW
jgi:cell wall-associated NlpC family hydrolase